MSSNEQDTKDALQLSALNLEQQNQKEANEKEAANQQAAETGAPQMNVQGDQKPEATDDAKKDGPKPSQPGKGGVDPDKNDKDIGAGGLNGLYTLAAQHAEAITNEAWENPMLGVLGKGNEPSANELVDKVKDKIKDFLSSDQEQDQDKEKGESLGLDQFNTTGSKSDEIELNDMTSNLGSVSDIVPK